MFLFFLRKNDANVFLFVFVFTCLEEEDESDDEFCDRTTAPVPKWDVLAGNRAVWVQLCQQLRLGQGSLG